MQINKKIRVLVVDDSPFFCNVLKRRLPENSNIEIIGTSANAFDAQRTIPKLKPDVVTLDVEMPGMSGIEFLSKVLPLHPVPVVLVSSLNISVFDALSRGAVDFVRKPDLSEQNGVDTFLRELRRKIVIASAAKVGTVHSTHRGVIPRGTMLVDSPKLDSLVIAIGASTGGTEAILNVLKSLPSYTPGIVIVQHMPEGFTGMYAKRLDGLCAMEVKEAKSGDKIQRGRVLIAPGNLQMKLVKIGSAYNVSCFSAEKVSGHRPSVDVLFRSMAENVGSKSVGVIMTGMGRDGADGLLNMRDKGAFTIGQDEKSCVVYGMPKAAYDIGAVALEVPCDNIADSLQMQLNKMTM